MQETSVNAEVIHKVNPSCKLAFMGMSLWIGSLNFLDLGNESWGNHKDFFPIGSVTIFRQLSM